MTGLYWRRDCDALVAIRLVRSRAKKALPWLIVWSLGDWFWSWLNFQTKIGPDWLFLLEYPSPWTRGPTFEAWSPLRACREAAVHVAGQSRSTQPLRTEIAYLKCPKLVFALLSMSLSPSPGPNDRGNVTMSRSRSHLLEAAQCRHLFSYSKLHSAVLSFGSLDLIPIDA